MLVLNPDRYLLPDYKISPFTTSAMEANELLPPNCAVDSYFENRFDGAPYQITLNAREALDLALRNFQLQPDDLVTILTTTQNFYVSSCVTGVIEKHCIWNRELTANTRVIVVVHEFGYPYRNMAGLKKLEIPIIEDVAYAFFSRQNEQLLGNDADYAIFSFPKMFPMQIGGLLVANNNTELQPSKVSDEQEDYIKKVISNQIMFETEIIAKRIVNYKWLAKRLSDLGLEERFVLDEGVVPGAFMFRSNPSIDLPELKKHLMAHGIQCSVFYGEEAFFIPVHQGLTEYAMTYMVAAIEDFIRCNP